MRQILIFIIVAPFFCSCAAFYKPISTATLAYSNSEANNDFDYSYEFDVLRKAGNKRYAKKEEKYDIQVVAVKIKNKTKKTVHIGEELQFSVGNNNVQLLSSKLVTHRLKQGVVGYSLYGLLFLTVSTGSQTNIYPIGIPVAIGNLLAAGLSNDAFKRNYIKNDLNTKSIAPGETVTGFVSFGYVSPGHLKINLK